MAECDSCSSQVSGESSNSHGSGKELKDYQGSDLIEESLKLSERLCEGMFFILKKLMIYIYQVLRMCSFVEGKDIIVSL